jgi:hypothetical protein
MSLRRQLQPEAKLLQAASGYHGSAEERVVADRFGPAGQGDWRDRGHPATDPGGRCRDSESGARPRPSRRSTCLLDWRQAAEPHPPGRERSWRGEATVEEECGSSMSRTSLKHRNRTVAHSSSARRRRPTGIEPRICSCRIPVRRGTVEIASYRHRRQGMPVR